MKKAIVIVSSFLLLFTITSCTKEENTYVTNAAFIQPEITISMPVPGDTLRGLVAISTQTTGNAEITRVEFYLDGVLPEPQAVDSIAPYQYLWNTESYTDDNHLVFARAWTPGGNYGDAVPMLVLVDNINENAPRNLRVPSQYPTIQQGVNAAREGDTVLVESGIYHEDFNFRGKGIWVKSEFGPEQTVWEGTIQNTFVYFNSSEDTFSVLCGFKIDNSYRGIGIDLNCSPKVSNCIFTNIDNTGIISDFTNGIFTNNTLYNCKYGMQLAGICYIKNNILVHSDGLGLWNASTLPEYRPMGDYNDIWDWAQGYYGNNWLIGEHDIHLDPLFMDTLEFRLQLNSPCKNVGDPLIFNLDGTRSDMGAWGGPNAYP